MIIFGIALIIAGLVMMYAFYDLVDIGMITAIIGVFFIILWAFTPKVEAKGMGYPSAGITKVIAQALSQPIEVEPAPVEEVGANAEDIDLLARLITAEIGYQTSYDPVDYEDACYICGSVVLNRMANDKFPDTLEGVIYQREPVLQYQCTVNGQIERPFDEMAFEIAEELLTYGTEVDPAVVYQSRSKQGSGVYRKIGRTYFCYE